MKRSYRMNARAKAAEETGQRLIAAMQALFVERPFHEVTLEAVAERAGVTLQTLLRRFGSKSGLLAAAAEDGAARVAAQREQAPAGDLAACVTNLVEHYEAWGDVSLRLLAQEDAIAEVGDITKKGRALHAAWVDRVFAEDIARQRGRERKIRRAQLVAICDVYTWKILRRDQGLSRADTEKALLGMLR
jgi:AcrR family transcriptional regulator